MSITYDQESVKLFPQRGESRFASFMGAGVNAPESSGYPRFSESIVAGARARKYLGHRARNPWDRTSVMNAGCQCGVRFSLSQKPAHGVDAELFLEVEIKFAIVPSLRERASATAQKCQSNNTSVALAFSA